VNREEVQPIKRSRLQSQREKSAPSTKLYGVLRVQKGDGRELEDQKRRGGGEDRFECDPRKLM
jgi:hypothetical protein